jgi:hypothetical protein
MSPTLEHQPPVCPFRWSGVQNLIDFLTVMEGEEERLRLVTANPHRVRCDLVVAREDIKNL